MQYMIDSKKAVDFSQLSNLWKLWINWPVGVTVRFSGSSLDTLARRPLWQYGLDFGHGTGHGIGMFLNVHEGKSHNFISLLFWPQNEYAWEAEANVLMTEQ